MNFYQSAGHQLLLFLRFFFFLGGGGCGGGDRVGGGGVESVRRDCTLRVYVFLRLYSRLLYET